ncbi:MAG TPA: 3-hydroxyacyl-CoA dehydrogenase NAD-binding domain-containing protein [Solirubrobacterales bacterium]|nr:3-hydroxyacyl-CoA dehydrogenase NAD-binding domain-containing protein [Solirubrobacterales bacterium]
MSGGQQVRRIGVVGAGTMGSGIAQVAVLGGFEAVLHDADRGALDAGLARARDGIRKGAERGRWSAAEGGAALGHLSEAAELAQLAGCELVIEAVPEILDLKRALLASMAAVCDPETVLATNTSSLRVAEIAAGVPNPECLVGMHFFNPPALMKLVEVVATEQSSDAALAAATQVAEQMGRTPIRARDTVGFVANRLARPFNLEALRMLGQGLAEPEEIDRAYKEGGGFRMGPFELIDLIGLDVNLTIARSFFAQGGEPERWRPSPIQERMVEKGRLGRKSGRGFYEYDESGKPRRQEVEVPFGPESSERNLAIEKEVLDRLFAQIANEAHFALAEDVASPDDMNTATKLCLNWPLGSL